MKTQSVADPLTQDNNPGDYVGKTVRSAALTAAFLTLGLAAKGSYAYIGPLLTGTTLGCLLLAAWERFASALFTAQAAREKKIRSRKGAILLFALVKYPLVAFLIYWVTRHWDQKQILWFLGGFVLFQAIIVLRALGRALTENSERPRR